MEVLYASCAGLDIHKQTVVACRVTPDPAGQPQKAIRTFGTLTDDLLALGDWLAEAGCTHVAMEATGVYWKPLYNLLEDRFTLLLVNARHIKTVPGRKTDVRDCEWIADLLRHGLLRASFVPARPERELRELTRYRTSLVQERAREVSRIQKTLEGANVKLSSVAADVLGTSGRAMLEALVAGTTDAAALADLAQGKLREKRAALERALTGRVGAHQRFLLAEQLIHLDDLAAQIARLSAEIAERLRPFAQELERLDAIPGVGLQTAEVLLAELGTDMTRFPTARHLASWAGMCPGNDESAGKRRSGKTRKGNKWLRTVLVEAAHGAAHSKRSYLAAQYAHLVPRRGTKRAAVAVGHSILVIVYQLLRTPQPYQDLGLHYLTARDQDRQKQRLVKRLEELGYAVTITPAA